MSAVTQSDGTTASIKEIRRERVLVDIISERDGIIETLVMENAALKGENDRLAGEVEGLKALKNK